MGHPVNGEYLEKFFGHFVTHFFTNLTWASKIYIEEILAWQQSVLLKLEMTRRGVQKISLCLCFIFDFFQFQVRSNRWFGEMKKVDTCIHGLQTPNGGINQRNQKIWADVADKICFGRNYKG